MTRQLRDRYEHCCSAWPGFAVRHTGPDRTGGSFRSRQRIADGTLHVVTRGAQGTTAADHAARTFSHIVLTEKVVIVPFVKGFFGSPASGDWKYSVSLPNVRLASAELYHDQRSRRWSQYGELLHRHSRLRTANHGRRAVFVSDKRLSRDSDECARHWSSWMRIDRCGIFSQLSGRLPMARASRCKSTGTRLLMRTLQFAPGSTISNVVSGFGLPPLRAGDQLSLDVIGVGTTVPGSDLS